MSVVTTIAGTDVVSSSRSVINSNFATLNAEKVDINLSYPDPPWLTSVAGTKVVGPISGNAATATLAAAATALATPRTIAGVSFDGTGNISISSTGLSDSASLVRTSGSYSDPAWITSISGSKVNGALAVPSVRLTGLAEPAANAGNEGLMVYIKGTSGVSGSLRICAQLTDGSYAWVPLF